MRLDDEGQQKVLAFLNTNWPQPRECPVCHKNQWSIHPTVYEVRSFGKGGLTVGGPVVPVVAVECVTCGNTHLLNAIRIGVVTVGGEEKHE